MRVVSGHADSTALPIANRYAALHIARPRVGPATVSVSVSADTEILYWEMHASFDVPRPA